MADKKNHFLTKFVLDAAVFVVSLFNLVPNLVRLIEMEARSAERNLISLLVMALIAVVLATSIWLCLLILIFIYLISLHLSMMTALFILLGVNILLLILAACRISSSRCHLSFPATREYLRSLNK